MCDAPYMGDTPLLNGYYNRETDEVTDAVSALYLLISDFTDRAGFGNVWDEMDELTKEDMLADWLAVLEGGVE